jgi:hypothetical protein
MLAIIKKNNRHYLMCFVEFGCIHASQTNLEVETQTWQRRWCTCDKHTRSHNVPLSAAIHSRKATTHLYLRAVMEYPRTSYVKGGAVISGDR